LVIRAQISLLLLFAFFAADSSILQAQASTPEGAPPIAASAAPSIQSAQRFYRDGKVDAAIQTYQAIETGPQAALAYAGLTHAYLRKRDAEDAYAAAAKAAELAPGTADTRVALGEIYYRQGKILDAEVEFVAVINSGASNARAYLGVSRVSNATSFYRRGKEMIDRAHDLDPEDPDINRYWMSTLTLGDRIKAVHDDLVRDGNDDAERRAALERELAALQNQPSIPAHPCKMTSKISSTQTDLRRLLIGPNSVRGYGLDVKLNGTTSHLLLDTGAGTIIVDRKIAEKAGIQEVRQTTIGGIGDRGPSGGYIARASSIQIGDIEFQDCNVEVVDKHSVVGEDGLIGAVVFSRFLVDIDLPHEKLRLSELPPRPDGPVETASLESGPSPVLRFHDRYVPPEMHDYSPVFRFGHQLLIPTKVNDSAPKLFLIDTGAYSNMITPEAAREVTKISGDARTTVYGLSGGVDKVYRGDDLVLTFGHLKQRNFEILAFDTKSMSDSIGTEISGSLGFSMLRLLDMKIDYLDGLISFTFDEKRFH
jgi:predicted aspartyl protease